MTARRSRSEWLVILLLGGLSALVAWCYSEMNAAQASVETVTKNLEVCVTMAEKIKETRQRPSRAALEDRSVTELATQVDKAAFSSGIAKDQIVRIEPQPSHRIGETEYKEQATFVEIRSTTLPQLVSFLHALIGDQSELDVSSLRLTAPRYDSAVTTSSQETWLAELTLSYLLFAPKQNR